MRAELTALLRLLPGQVGHSAVALWHEQCGREEGLA
jgi:hypothetical protein